MRIFGSFALHMSVVAAGLFLLAGIAEYSLFIALPLSLVFGYYVSRFTGWLDKKLGLGYR